ncbi:MAG: ABC transporter permease, partial [Nitriliruptoraceae bacterium]
QFDYGASTQLFLFIFLTSLAASAAVIQVRNLGIASRMLSAPILPRTLVFGLAGGRVGVAMTQALYIVVATWLLFRVNWGDPLATTVLVLVFCLLSAAAAVVLGSLFRNDAQASGVGVGVGLVFAALGGSMAPLELFPEGLQRVAMITPHRWANTAMAELVRRDGTIVDIVPELGVLLAYTAVLTVAAAVLMRRALTR